MLLVTTIQLEDSRRTAVGNTEEGGDDVKSSCLLRLGLHTCYNGRYKEKRSGNSEQNSKSRSQFGLWAATRPHEDGVASNPGSARQGECVPGSCTHRLSRHGSWRDPKPVSQPSNRRQPSKVKPATGVKS